jgi:hypothetical protein
LLGLHQALWNKCRLWICTCWITERRHWHLQFASHIFHFHVRSYLRCPWHFSVNINNKHFTVINIQFTDFIWWPFIFSIKRDIVKIRLLSKRQRRSLRPL